MGLLGKGEGLAAVVGSMTKLFAHKSVSVMTIERLFGDSFVFFNIACPWQVRPDKSSNRRMYISRLESVQEGSISEEIPFDCADDIAFS